MTSKPVSGQLTQSGQIGHVINIVCFIIAFGSLLSPAFNEYINILSNTTIILKES